MIGSLRRLSRMPRQELTWRLRERGRIERRRLSYLLRRPRWNRADIRTALAADVLDEAVLEAIAAGEWGSVHAVLYERLLERPSRYVLDPKNARLLRQTIAARWPEASGDAARRADRLLAGRYDLLGYRGVSFRDWHTDPVSGGRMPLRFWASVPYLEPECGDHKVIWELNRHQHWLALGRAAWLTGDARYADAIVTGLGSWLEANPPLIGGNWTSMLELGVRSLSWTWALHVLLNPAVGTGLGRPDGEPWLVDMLVGLDRQLAHVADNLSYYFSPNTHLTGEALALYVVGTALPELARSEEWAGTGRRVLLAESERQVAPDGGHVERSMHYQRYTLDFYLLALMTAEIAGDDRAATACRHICGRLAEFTFEMAGEHGRLPLIGDDDGGMLWPIAGREPSDVSDSLAVAAVLLERPELGPREMPEEAVWITGGVRVPRATEPRRHRVPSPGRLRMRVFPDTGYVVMRDADHLVFDVGQHGYLNAGHAHADALAVTLDIGGRPLLIDPGTGTYTMDRRIRDLMRSSISHNTLTLDGRSSAVASGPFHWASRADARLEAWRGNDGFAWAEAAHGGYGSVQHRRSIFRGAGAGWVILDEVLGDGRHRADVHWHFAPDWRVTRETGKRLHLAGSDGRTAWLVHEPADVWLAYGDEESGLGWCSPIYGQYLPASTARVGHEAAAPFSMAVWLGSGDAAPTVDRIQIACDGVDEAIGVRVRQGDRVWTTVLRPGERPERDGRSCSSPEYHADARVVHYGTCAGAFTTLSLADASHLLSLRAGLVSVASDTHVEDLHLSVHRESLDLRASMPPPRLRLEGSGLAGVRSLRLNGRELRRREEPIEVIGADWALCVESPVSSI
jgi:hypothetical protein